MPPDTNPEPTVPVETAPVETAPAASAAPATPAAAPKKTNRRKLLLVAAAAVVVLVGGSAAAFYGVVVPNRPANVLKSALQNSLQQKQSSFDAQVTVSPTQGGAAYKADIKGAEDTVAKAADLNISVTASGLTFPVEARLVDKNVYFKLGDLSSLATTLSGISPDIGSVVNKVASTLSNKWIVVDSTLIQESGADCVLNADWSLSSADVKALTDSYEQHPFATVQSVSGDTVNGQKVKKFQLSIDDDKLATYAKKSQNLSMFDSLKKCSKGTTTPDASGLSDHQKTPLTLWVNPSSKQVVQIASQSTAKDAFKASFNVDFTYQPVSITAPANATPVLQVVSQVEQALGVGSSGSGLDSLFQGFNGSTSL